MSKSGILWGVVAVASLAFAQVSCGGNASSSACGGTGTGKLNVEVAGLPIGVFANVTVSGPGGSELVRQSETIGGLPAGSYTITVGTVTSPDPAHTVYRGYSSEPSACVDGSTAPETVLVSYSAAP